jgi:hypothetical protein
MLALGLQSKRDITRTRIRVRTAMAAQTREQGRYLGGRPPWAGGGSYPRAMSAAARRTRTACRLTAAAFVFALLLVLTVTEPGRTLMRSFLLAGRAPLSMQSASRCGSWAGGWSSPARRSSG